MYSLTIETLVALSINLYVVAESSNSLFLGYLISLNNFILYNLPHADKSTPLSYKILYKASLESIISLLCLEYFLIVAPVSYWATCSPIDISDLLFFMSSYKIEI